jgi:hypothetical protein
VLTVQLYLRQLFQFVQWPRSSYHGHSGSSGGAFNSKCDRNRCLSSPWSEPGRQLHSGSRHLSHDLKRWYLSRKRQWSFCDNGVGSLDGNGLAFILSDGAQINLYNPDGSTDDVLLERANGTNAFEDVAITIAAVALVPEPSTFALLGTGLLGVDGVVKRRIA